MGQRLPHHPPPYRSTRGEAAAAFSKKKERARKHLGMFLLGTLGAVHEQGPFQNVTFTLGIDSGLIEIIFQIKAVFLKPKNHTWSVKVWILKIQSNQI